MSKTRKPNQCHKVLQHLIQHRSLMREYALLRLCVQNLADVVLKLRRQHGISIDTMKIKSTAGMSLAIYYLPDTEIAAAVEVLQHV